MNKLLIGLNTLVGISILFFSSAYPELLYFYVLVITTYMILNLKTVLWINQNIQEIQKIENIPFFIKGFDLSLAIILYIIAIVGPSLFPINVFLVVFSFFYSFHLLETQIKIRSRKRLLILKNRRI